MTENIGNEMILDLNRAGRYGKWIFQNVISDLESQVPSVCFQEPRKEIEKADRTWRKCDSYFFI